MAEQPVIGHTVRRFPAVESTNDAAKELLDDDPVEGLVVVADRQVAGRGRHGRAWVSPPGGLYVSVILQPEEKGVQVLSLLSGIPVVKALRHYGVLATLRWPNDVVFVDRKIAGILCEGVHRRDRYYVIAGIGVNTNVDVERFPAELRPKVTTLKHEVDFEVNHDEFLEYMLRHYTDVYRAYRSGAKETLLRDYRGLCTTINRNVAVDTDEGVLKGRAVDITKEGHLLVVDEAGARHTVAEGSVSVVA
jgi:BirA family biotin operon repressor/biotin-[acetyl-CoA-carboxylase] ligase